MEAATTTQDVLGVEKQLRNVVNEKESKAKQKAYFEKGVEMSTLTLQITERPPELNYGDDGDNDFGGWSAFATLKRAMNSLSKWAAVAADALIFTAVWALPALGAFAIVRFGLSKLKLRKPWSDASNPL